MPNKMSPNTPISDNPTMGQPPMQPQTPKVPQPAPNQAGQGGEASMNEEEKLLIQFLKQMQQSVMDLSQRVDVLEQKSGEAPM
ncbi:MAG TPA: hypothetical protein VIY48_06900 [Candidatus Paceibacterota bacterium]